MQDLGKCLLIAAFVCILRKAQPSACYLINSDTAQPYGPPRPTKKGPQDSSCGQLPERQTRQCL